MTAIAGVDVAAAASRGLNASAKRPLTLKFDPKVVTRNALPLPVPRPALREPPVDPDLVPKAGPSLSVTTSGTAERDQQTTTLANEQSRNLRQYLDDLGLQQVSIRYTARF